jgi:predicted ATPase
VDDAFIRSVQLLPADDPGERVGYPWELAPVRARLDGVALHPKVTYLIGENGSGKSTLLEAIALAAGMNAEGGSSSTKTRPRSD